MKAEVLAFTQSTLLPELSLILFVLVFCVSLYRAYRPSAKAYYQRVGAIVLDDAPSISRNAEDSK